MILSYLLKANYDIIRTDVFDFQHVRHMSVKSNMSAIKKTLGELRETRRDQHKYFDVTTGPEWFHS